jgi:hypothetical protein
MSSAIANRPPDFVGRVGMRILRRAVCQVVFTESLVLGSVAQFV